MEYLPLSFWIVTFNRGNEDCVTTRKFPSIVLALIFVHFPKARVYWFFISHGYILLFHILKNIVFTKRQAFSKKVKVTEESHDFEIHFLMGVEDLFQRKHK